MERSAEDLLQAREDAVARREKTLHDREADLNRRERQLNERERSARLGAPECESLLRRLRCSASFPAMARGVLPSQKADPRHRSFAPRPPVELGSALHPACACKALDDRQLLSDMGGARG